MPKYIKKKDLKNAIDECTWYHIGKNGELVEGANSSEHEPLYKYSDIKEIIKNLPTRKFENEPKRTALSKALKWTYGDEPSNSEKPNNCEDLQDWKDRMWAEAIVTEPQPTTDCRQTDCYMCKWLGEVDVCGRCRNRNLFAEADTEPKPKDEPITQTKTQNSNLTFEKADEPQTENGIGCSRCEGRYDCYDRDMPNAVHCNNYGKVTDEPQTDCAWK